MVSPLEAWTDFHVALAGAAAALAGLLIVAMSVNVSEILKWPTVPARAATAIGALVLALVSSLLALIPGNPLWGLGIEVLVGLAVVGAMQIHAIRVIWSEPTSPLPHRLSKGSIGVLPLAAYAVGVVLLLGDIETGVVFVAVGSILSIVASVVFSWVVLIELLR